MTINGISRKLLAWTLVVLMLGSALGGLPAGALKTLDETNNGLQTDIVDFASSGSDNTSIGLTLPAGAASNVVNASFDIRGLSHTPGGTDYPMGPVVDIGDDGLSDWEFTARGFHSLGFQRLFLKGINAVNEETFTFSSPGSDSNLKMRLPYTAQISSATVDVVGSLESVDMNLNDTVAGESPDDFYGEWMTAGDFNGDGHEDLVVCARSTAAGGTVYVYNGTAQGFNTTADYSYSDPSPLVMFAWSAAAGDYNGDTYDDLAVSAPLGGGVGGGYVGVVYGGPTGLSLIGGTLVTGAANGDNFGWSLSSANVNNDDYDDLLATSTGAGGGTGEAYVFHGTAGGIATASTASADSTITYQFAGDAFGIVITTAGDVNGDNFDDVAISAQGALSGAGKVFVFHGSASGIGSGSTANADVVLQGKANATINEGMGTTMAGDCDINGDGFDDLLVGGEYYNNSGGSGATIDGKVWIFYGNTSGLALDENDTLMAPQTDDGFGQLGLSAARDVNDDGFDDVVVGAMRRMADNGGIDLFLGSEEGISDTSIDSVPGGPSDSLGVRIVPLGDMNDDGFDDFVVSAPMNNANTGAAYVYQSTAFYPTDLDLDMGGDGLGNQTKAGVIIGQARYDILDDLDQYLSTVGTTTNDTFGNEFVEFPVKLTTASKGIVRLFNLSIVFDWTGSIEFADVLNGYLEDNQDKADVNGDITVPITFTVTSAGKIEVSNINIGYAVPPSLSQAIPDLVMDEDTVEPQLVDLQQYFSDDDAMADLNFSVAVKTPAVLSIANVTVTDNRYVSVDMSTGDLDDNWTGEFELEVTCEDTDELSVKSNQFKVTVNNTPDRPVIVSTHPAEAEVGIGYQYDINAVDGDIGDILTYTLLFGPTGMTLDKVTGLIKWTPSYRYLGENVSVTVDVEDSTGLKVQPSYQFLIHVTGTPATNHAPVVTEIDDRTVTKDVPFLLQVEAYDSDQYDILTYELKEGPTGMAVDENGTLTWLPTALGIYQVRIVVTDGLANVEVAFNVTVVMNQAQNTPPKFTSTPGAMARTGQDYIYEPTATDDDVGTVLTFSLKKGPSNMDVNRTSGKVTFRPLESQVGDVEVILQVSDGVAKVEQNWTIKVLPSVIKPAVAITKPSSGARVKDTIAIEGTATIIHGTITKVQVKMDEEGTWADAKTEDGWATWSFSQDTKKLKNGQHTIFVRALSSETDSDNVTLVLTVENKKGGIGDDDGLILGLSLMTWLVLIIVIVVVVVVAAVAASRKKKTPPPVQPGPGAPPAGPVDQQAQLQQPPPMEQPPQGQPPPMEQPPQGQPPPMEQPPQGQPLLPPPQPGQPPVPEPRPAPQEVPPEAPAPAPPLEQPPAPQPPQATGPQPPPQVQPTQQQPPKPPQ